MANLLNNLEKTAHLFAENIISHFNLNCHLDRSSLAIIRAELVEKFQNCHKYLDKKFTKEILSGDHKKIVSSLWEIIILSSLKNNSSITIADHKVKGPDWKIKVGEYEYYIEATCAHLPNSVGNSEIHRLINKFSHTGTTVSDEKLPEEVKSRISNAISGKINRDANFMGNQKAGYILCVSYGSFPLYSSCDLYKAVETILPVSSLRVEIDAHNQSMYNEHLSYKGCFKKLTTGAVISTDVFGNEAYAWISAVLFSKAEPCLLLENSNLFPSVNWNGVKNDFVLVHNQKAKYPLQEDIFGCRTIILPEASKLKVGGDSIFPTFQHGVSD